MRSFLYFSFTLSLSLLFGTYTHAQTDASTYHIIRHIKVGGKGGWDYITAFNGRLYVAHDSLVNVIDEKTGTAVGVIKDTYGAHGIAFDPEAGKGYVTASKIRGVLIFDLKTNEETGRVKTAMGPDAIIYDPFTKKILVLCGKGNAANFIDPLKQKVTDTISLGGKPEEAVTDGEGNIYVNIEDKNEVVHIDARTLKITDQWKIGKGDGPSGLAIDKLNKRLFIGCNKLTVVMNATDGKIIAEIPTGDGVDGMAFDPAANCAFSPNGEGTLSIIHAGPSGKYSVVKTLPTKKGARTITLDIENHNLYLPVADLEVSYAPHPPAVPGSFEILEIGK